MLTKPLAVLSALITISLGGSLLFAKPSEAHSSGYCGHGTVVTHSARIRYIRSLNRGNQHWHYYLHNHRQGRDHYQWKRCPSH
ncbi:hypothetical protein MiSe_04770 [Microseira wollei NIES-4236]|uniref:Uncharacterized protein n=1 Tax=Microseira wollei NIES-4236 TaxID=2530354 RepID=A0AAV3WZC4_9CYAN|nr:hypothetical protein MiSe_04770 [Microseira wollei NIES-4236]